MLTEILSKLSKTEFSSYQSTSTIKLLFDVQMWLIRNELAVVTILCLDDFDSWGYRILIPDMTCPFFEPEYDRFNQFSTYEDALTAGILKTLESIGL